MRGVSNISAVKLAFWTSRGTWLVGPIGAVAVPVVEPAPREGARAVPAGDHLGREVRLILGRNADERWRGVGGAGEEEEAEQ